MARLGLLIDVTKCSGCHNCFLACRDEYYDNDYSPYSAPQPLDGQFWMQVEGDRARAAIPSPSSTTSRTPCLHCEDAPCIDVAADNAVYRRADGFVIIDPEKAKGQKAIVNACPYRVVFWNKELDIPQKCTMCAHRLDEGEKEPRCVEACPTGALTFGDLDDPNSDDLQATWPRRRSRPSTRVRHQADRDVRGHPQTVRGRRSGAGRRCGRVRRGRRRSRWRATASSWRPTSDSYGDFEFEGLDKNKAFKVTVELDGYAPQDLRRHHAQRRQPG